MDTDQIANLIRQQIPNIQVDVEGGEGRYHIRAVSDIFSEMGLVRRQQTIYQCIDEHIKSGAIHAVTMALSTPDEKAD